MPLQATTGLAAGADAVVVGCVERVEVGPVVHYERIWWILAANPFVVIADAAPAPPRGPSRTRENTESGDILTQVRWGIREMRLGGPATRNYCSDDVEAELRRAAERDRRGGVWPYGLAADLAIGAGFTVVAVRRLRTPARDTR